MKCAISASTNSVSWSCIVLHSSSSTCEVESTTCRTGFRCALLPRMLSQCVCAALCAHHDTKHDAKHCLLLWVARLDPAHG